MKRLQVMAWVDGLLGSLYWCSLRLYCNVSPSHSFHPSLHGFLSLSLSFLCFHQQQSGLISRVTDTVKSIVPSWLQKYFKNGDAPEGGGAVPGIEQNCQSPPPPNGSEEGPPPIDGRDSPEPSTSNTGEGLCQSLRSLKRLAREFYIPYMHLADFVLSTAPPRSPVASFFLAQSPQPAGHP